MMDITLVTCFSITIFVAIYTLLFFPNASKVLIIGIIALVVFIIGREPFSFRLLKMYENGISLPGKVNVWRTLIRNTEDYIQYADIRKAYPNINCPKWAISGDHFTLVLKDGKEHVIRKYDVLSIKKLAEVLNKQGKSVNLSDSRKGMVENANTLAKIPISNVPLFLILCWVLQIDKNWDSEKEFPASNLGVH